MAIIWDQSRWEQTYGFRLNGNVAAEGYAEPFGACTLDAATDTITKASHGYIVDDMVYFQSLPVGSGLCDNQVDCPYLVMSVTVDTFQVRPNTNIFDPIPLLVSGPAEVAKSRKGEWLTYSSELFSRDDRGVQFGLRRDRIKAAFPEMQTSDRILIVGCSHLGLEVKAFLDDGFSNVWGVDRLDWEPENPAPGVIIVKGNIAAPAIRAALRKPPAQGGTGDDVFDWIIDSDILTSAADDAEAAQWVGVGPEILGTGGVQGNLPAWRIIHLVTISAPPPFLSKTLLQWQALDPSQSWADPDAKTILRGT